MVKFKRKLVREGRKGLLIIKKMKGANKMMKKKVTKSILGWGILVSLCVTQFGNARIIEASEQNDISFEDGIEDDMDVKEDIVSSEEQVEVEVEEKPEINEEVIQEINENSDEIGEEVQNEEETTTETLETEDFCSELGSETAPKYIAKGTNGDLSWTLDNKGCFVLEGTGSDDDEYALDWLSYTDKIKSASVNISGVTSVSGLFRFCGNLKTINFKNSDFSQVTDMSEMFEGCSGLETINLSQFNTSTVVNMSHMFDGCSNLKSLNLSKFNTSNAVDISGMFAGCSSLKKLNLSSFSTSKITDMSWLFYECSELQEVNLKSFNTLKVTNMSSMFDGCESLKSIDLSKFVISSKCKVDYLFEGCGNLTNIKTIPNLKVTIKLPDSISVTGNPNLQAGLVDWVDSSGNKYKTLPKNKKGSITLIRKKKGAYCTIIFDPNGGKVSEKSRNISVGDTYGTLPTASRVGYNFAGWYTAKKGGKKVDSKTKVNQKGRLTVYAHWTLKTSVKKADIKIKSCTYNGKKQEPSVNVKIGNKTLKENKDFTVKYSNNINAGTRAVVTITGKGLYRDSIIKKFKINPLRIDKKVYVKLTKDLYTWDGKEKKPGVAVYVGRTLPGSTVVTLQNKKDYTYKYKNNKEPGTATVVVAGKGNYTGTKTVAYKINKRKQPTSVNPTSLKKTYADIRKTYAITVSGKKESAKMTCTSNNKKVVDIDKNNKIVLKGCGKAIVSVKFSETKHYKAAEEKITVVVLKKQDIQTQFKNGTKVGYTVNPVSLGANAKGKLSYELTEDSDPQIASIDQNGNLILKNAKKLGTVTIRIRAGETADYAGAVKEITITTVKGTPVINCDPTMVYDVLEGGFNLTVSSDVPLNYRSSDDSIAQVNADGTVKFMGGIEKGGVRNSKIIISSSETEFYNSASKEIDLSIASNPYPEKQDMDEDKFDEVPCTYFAWQQTINNMKIILPDWGNAINWLDCAKNAKYETGREPRANSIAVWSGANGYGHVAYVTEVSGNTFVVNEGGRTDLDDTPSHGVAYGFKITNAVGESRPNNPDQILLGFIYL